MSSVKKSKKNKIKKSQIKSGVRIDTLQSLDVAATTRTT